MNSDFVRPMQPPRFELSNQLNARLCAMEITVVALLGISHDRPRLLALLEDLAVITYDLFPNAEEEDRQEIAELVRERIAWFVQHSGGP